ncbi:hypothetical protein ACWGDT_11690 [Streptomyces avermitilis]
MARAGMSMQELIRRRRRAGFVGRREELRAFRENFDLPVDDDRHRFLFHVHGPAGVGKAQVVEDRPALADQDLDQLLIAALLALRVSGV